MWQTEYTQLLQSNKSKDINKHMKTVLQELAILPGVIGSCICLDSTAILASSLPASFSNTMATDAKSTEQEYVDSKTTEALEQIKTALFDTVGPVAEMVYEDCLLQWTENKPADVARIFEFLACISKEIDNDELFGEFKNKIASLL